MLCAPNVMRDAKRDANMMERDARLTVCMMLA